MTTKKPGSDQQQPLYGCVSCFEYQTFPDDHLRVYDGNCYCEDCWDAYPADADIEWTSLGSFTPALQAECEKLRNLLVEIERGCSRRDMPSEQTISSWADAIDEAIQGDKS